MKVLTQLDSLDNVIDGDTRKLLTKTASGGSGNVVSGVSISGDTITYTKGVSALTADSILNAGKLDGDIADGVTAVTQVNGDNSTKIATTAYVDNALSAQPEPMVFKGTVGTGGTITTLPIDGSANVGETYKVITNGTYAGQAAKVGDTFVCERKVGSLEELFDYGYQVTNQYDSSGDEQSTSRYTLENNVITISRNKSDYGRYFLNKTNLAAGTYTLIFVPTLSGTEKKISYSVKDLDNQVEIVEETLTIVDDEEITKEFTLSTSRTVSIELQPRSSSCGTLTLSDISLTLPNGTNTWAYIPSGDEPSGTVTSVKINATGPIAIDSNAAITTSGERTISHANSGVTAGTYKSVTVNATGHVTAGSNPTTISGYGITDAKINNGVITLGSNTITPLTAHQNAFSNVKVGSTTVAADSAGDTLELVAGSNVTLTPDATNDKVTIAATDTTYESKAAASGGTAVSLVTTGEKYTWNNKQNALSTQTAYSAKGTATKVPQITTNTLGQVTKIEEVTITQPTVNNGTLTIQKNGTNVQTFSANQSGNATANITVPTKVSELTNDSGYTTNTGTITGITMNGASKGTSGVVDLGTVITSHQSIKTINNNTITGTGNVSVGTITGVSVNGTSVATSGVANITSLPASILTGTVPTGCYTDTKNTTGSTDTSSKIFLVGATTQAANPQTYSDNEIFATNGVLSTKSVQVGGALATMQYNSTDECVEFVFA